MQIDADARRALEFVREMDLDRDMWEKAAALTAMLTSGVPELRDFADLVLRRAIQTQTSAGHLSFNDPINLSVGHIRGQVLTHTTVPASLGYPLLLLNDSAPEELFLDAARRQAAAALAAPRSRDGGLSMRAEGVELWIDFTYLLCPFLAKLGIVTQDPELIDEAFRQLRVHIDHLVDPATGLPRHSWVETPNHYSQSSFWSRGIGWLGCGLVDLIALVPGHAGVGHAVETLQRLGTAVTDYQDANGYWRNVLDDPQEPYEASGTVMHAYWLSEGVRAGFLPEVDLARAASAVEAVRGSLRSSGAVPGVTVPPGGPGVPLGVTAFGQGFFALAAQSVARTQAQLADR